MSKRYVPRKGVSDQYVRPPPGYKGRNKWMNYHGFRIMVGVARSPFFLNEIMQAIHKQESCIVIFTGKPGKGKSYSALRIAQMVDRRFDPDKQVAFKSADLLDMIAPSSQLKRGQVVMVDEAQFVMGARRWYEDVQKDLMDHLESVRSRGLIIFIIALSIDVLDKVVREFVLSHMVYQEDRGSMVPYRLWKPRFGGGMRSKRMGRVKLLLPGFKDCKCRTCLTCVWKGSCLNIRARYERRKRAFIEEKIRESRSKGRKTAPSEDIQLQTLLANLESIEITKMRKLNLDDMREVLEEKLNFTPVGTILVRLRRRIERTRPEFFVKPAKPTPSSLPPPSPAGDSEVQPGGLKGQG